jgi:taurine dioxygenase
MAIEFEPLTAAVGATVHGVDMANVSDNDIDGIRKGWMDHKVLFFRNQDITIEEHIAFGARFGELEIHPFANGREGYPEIVRIESTPDRQYAADNWHSDVTWRQEPSLGSVLRGVVMPPVGGDTCFSNTAKAYDNLSDAWKERVEDMVAVHDFSYVFGGRLTPEKLAEQQAKYPPAHHPVVRTHPETGEKNIYTNRGFVSHIEGMNREESMQIIDHLERAVMDPSVQCRFKWEVDSFAMWDNRAVQHCATNDFWPETRIVERVTIIGDKPY